MANLKKYPVSRRNFIKVSAISTAAVSAMSLGSCNVENVPAPMKRKFGKLGFDVTSIGLGGQASLQWTPDDVDPVPIILKAFKLGINYFDTSNLYADSQLNYNKAFEPDSGRRRLQPPIARIYLVNQQNCHALGKTRLGGPGKSTELVERERGTMRC